MNDGGFNSPWLRLRSAALFLAALLAPHSPIFAQTTWQEALAKMPLSQPVAELNHTNAVKVMLASFQRNPAVKALIFMPGATDEFYFFHRARAKLTNSSPTLLDAVVALTNQTHIRATLRPPFLLLHTAEDPLEPVSKIEDQKTADSIKRHKYDKAAVYNDCDWDYMEHWLGFFLNTNMRPRPFSHDSNHFFRHSFAEFDLNGWEALEAVAMAGKTKFTVQKNKVIFEGDERLPALPPTDGFTLDPF
jgi:hypothetical protein